MPREESITNGSDMIGAALETWVLGEIDHFCQDLTIFVKEHDQLTLSVQPIAFRDSGNINAEVLLHDSEVKISFHKMLLDLLAVYNISLPRLGLDAATKGEVDSEQCQRLFDLALTAVYSITSGSQLHNMFDRLYDHKAYQEYKRTHAQLAAPGTASVVKQFSDANGLDGLEWFRENLVENISLSISMTELGVKWLLLHELGHAALGHLSQPSKEGHEREYAADRFATERFLPYLRARYDLSNVPITTAAVAALFVVIDFLEFIVKLANNCIRLSMPKDFRKGFRGIGWTHPSTSERANRILKSFPQFMDQLNNSWAEILEGGMLTVKRAIHLGLIDLRYFKRFCRISGQQMSAAYVMKSVAPGVKEKLAQVLSVYDDWDSADVNPGPLIDDVFEGVFNAPLFMRR